MGGRSGGGVRGGVDGQCYRIPREEVMEGEG